MTDEELMDRFAMAALPQAMVSDYGLDWGKRNKDWSDKVAKEAYRIAVSMMLARRETGNLSHQKSLDRDTRSLSPCRS